MTQVAQGMLQSSHDLAISVDRVTQRFSLRHEKTLKGMLVSTVTRKHPIKETFLALDDVSLEIPAGMTMGLIGHNGSGKSTLLKIIGGVLTPTLGQVTRRGRLAALLELGAGFNRDLSGRENVFLNGQLLGLTKGEIAKKFDDIVEFSGVEQFIDTPMKFYSSGMFVRLGFAVAIHTDPDVLLVDEVLAVGDEQFRAKCLDVIRRMQNEGRTIVLVTHGMDQVVQFCDQAILLHHGQVRAQGVPADVIAAFRSLTAEDSKRPLEKTAKTAEGATPAPRSCPTVEAVAARTKSGGAMSGFRSGDSVVVEVTVQGVVEQPCHVRVALFQGGHLVFGTSTDRLGVDPVSGDRELTFAFTLPDLPLAGGQYRIAASTAADRDSPPLHTVPAAVEFAIPVDGRSVGPVALDASVREIN